MLCVRYHVHGPRLALQSIFVASMFPSQPFTSPLCYVSIPKALGEGPSELSSGPGVPATSGDHCPAAGLLQPESTSGFLPQYFV